jgi:HTH-type transcriptional repressor of NAD biosynthesis genes
LLSGVWLNGKKELKKVTGSNMRKGLVFGKFMPLHNGHLALINFALLHCDHLCIILCYTHNEPIDGLIRKQWLRESFEHNTNITLFSYQYDDKKLPNTSVSSPRVSEIWASVLRALVPDAAVVYTSEDYGDYLANYMGIEHLLFDKARTVAPISATTIRTNPLLYWSYIADAAKPWFVKKIAIVGSESTVNLY